jgi:hypothetical protein
MYHARRTLERGNRHGDSGLKATSPATQPDERPWQARKQDASSSLHARRLDSDRGLNLQPCVAACVGLPECAEAADSNTVASTVSHSGPLLGFARKCSAVLSPVKRSDACGSICASVRGGWGSKAVRILRPHLPSRNWDFHRSTGGARALAAALIAGCETIPLWTRALQRVPGAGGPWSPISIARCTKSKVCFRRRRNTARIG